MNKPTFVMLGPCRELRRLEDGTLIATYADQHGNFERRRILPDGRVEIITERPSDESLRVEVGTVAMGLGAARG